VADEGVGGHSEGLKAEGEGFGASLTLFWLGEPLQVVFE